MVTCLLDYAAPDSDEQVARIRAELTPDKVMECECNYLKKPTTVQNYK